MPSEPVTRLLWDAEQTAEALSVRADTVKSLHRCGRLVGVKCGKHLRWVPRAVRDFVEALDAKGNGRAI